MMSLTGMRINNASSGLTLLELLVTVTLVSVSLVIILGAFSLTLRISGITEDHLKVNNIISNKLGELEFVSGTQGLSEGETTNDLGNGFIANESVRKESDPSQLNLVKLDISWPKGNRSIATYVINKSEEENTQ